MSKTFTLAIELDGTEDNGDIAEKLRCAGGSFYTLGVFDSLACDGVAVDSDGNTIATWEVR